MRSLPMKTIVFLVVYRIGQLTLTGGKLCYKTINKGYSKYKPHKSFWFWSTTKWVTLCSVPSVSVLERFDCNTCSCYPYPYRPKCTSQRRVECCSLFVSLWNLAAFFFFSIIFTGESKWILVDWLRPSRFPLICFSKKHHCKSAYGLLFFINSQRALIHRNENRFIKCTWFRVFCTCLLCWVCRLIKSERSGESPSLSARRLCKTCIFNKSFCKERGGLESLKNRFWNVLPNMFLFCLGIAKIAFQLDAVKFAIELILRIQNNDQSSVCTCSFGWVAWKSKRSGVSPSLSARELGFYWLWLASPFWTK